MLRILTSIFTIIIFSSLLIAQKQNAGVKEIAADPAPVSYGIVVDNSGSYRSLLEKIIQLTEDLVEVNKAEDETFLVTFVSSEKIVLRQDFTVRKSDIHDAAENMFIEGGLTAILDAVKFSAEHLVANARAEPGRSKVLVLLTDGDERQSDARIDDVLKLLKDAGIRVYVVGIADGKIYPKIIDRLAKETGGAVYLPKTRVETATAVKQLAGAIRRK